MRCLSWGLVVCAAGVCSACGGKSDADPDGGTADAAVDVKLIKKDASIDTGSVYQPQGKKCDPPTKEAPPVWQPNDGGAPMRPPIMQSRGGPTLTNPQFIAITFDGDDLRDPIEDFISSVGCTSYWRSVVTDYGINDGYAAPPVHLTDTPPSAIDDSQIGVFLRQKVLNKEIPDPVANQTLYIVYYPDGTDITLQGAHSCTEFGGYHNEVGLPDGRTLSYAVIPRCGGFGPLGGSDELTATSSHELMEAVTDPLPLTKPAFDFPEENGIAWAVSGGGEIGDLCEMNDDAFFLPSDYPFYVQHQWASHSAFAAHDPCQPSATVYFAAAPTLPDVIPYDLGFGQQSTTGVKLAVNGTTTIALTLIADAAWGSPINVTVHDGSHFLGGNTALNFALPTSQGNVGDKLQLQISRIGTNNQIGLEPFVIHATSQGVTRSWWAVVGDP